MNSDTEGVNEPKNGSPTDEDSYSNNGYCEDYPCCGHRDSDPCPGRGSPMDEPWYCDDCGYMHYGLLCPNN